MQLLSLGKHLISTTLSQFTPRGMMIHLERLFCWVSGRVKFNILYVFVRQSLGGFAVISSCFCWFDVWRHQVVGWDTHTHAHRHANTHTHNWRLKQILEPEWNPISVGEWEEDSIQSVLRVQSWSRVVTECEFDPLPLMVVWVWRRRRGRLGGKLCNSLT